MSDTPPPLTDQQLVEAVAVAITEDALRPRAERLGLVHAMLGAVQPELARLRAERDQARADVERLRTREADVRTARREENARAHRAEAVVQRAQDVREQWADHCLSPQAADLLQELSTALNGRES